MAKQLNAESLGANEGNKTDYERDKIDTAIMAGNPAQIPAGGGSPTTRMREFGQKNQPELENKTNEINQKINELNEQIHATQQQRAEQNNQPAATPDNTEANQLKEQIKQATDEANNSQNELTRAQKKMKLPPK